MLKENKLQAFEKNRNWRWYKKDEKIPHIHEHGINLAKNGHPAKCSLQTDYNLYQNSNTVLYDAWKNNIQSQKTKTKK